MIFTKEIIKSITVKTQIKYEVTKEGIICNNGDTAKYVWGSTICMVDLGRHLRDLKDGRYLMTWQTIIDRKIILRNRLEMCLRTIALIKDAEKLREKINEVGLKWKKE